MKPAYLGELPAGDWRMYAIGKSILLVDRSGVCLPRMVVDGKLIVLRSV